MVLFIPFSYCPRNIREKSTAVEEEGVFSHIYIDVYYVYKLVGVGRYM